MPAPRKRLSPFHYHVQFARLSRLLEEFVIALSLIGIGNRERGNRSGRSCAYGSSFGEPIKIRSRPKQHSMARLPQFPASC